MVVRGNVGKMSHGGWGPRGRFDGRKYPFGVLWLRCIGMIYRVIV